MLEATNLTLHYGGSQILHGIDINARPGSVTCVMGNNGVGKTSLMNLLAGIFRPSAGKVFVGESELSTAPSRDLDRLRATDVGLMLQGAGRNLLPHATPADNVRFAQHRARRAGRDLAGPEEAADLDHAVLRILSV